MHGEVDYESSEECDEDLLCPSSFVMLRVLNEQVEEVKRVIRHVQTDRRSSSTGRLHTRLLSDRYGCRHDVPAVHRPMMDLIQLTTRTSKRKAGVKGSS